jgi:hypothetical protein
MVGYKSGDMATKQRIMEEENLLAMTMETDFARFM